MVEPHENEGETSVANHDAGVPALPSSPADAPTVFVSARLRCRHWVVGDRDALLEVYGDGDAMRWVGDGTALSEVDADRWLDVTAWNYVRRGYGMFALEDRATGQVAGFAGLVHPGDQPEAEVKYAVSRPWWGRGLATEAVRHLLEAGASRYGLTDVIATVALAHVAPQRVLAKAGLGADPRQPASSGRSAPDRTAAITPAGGRAAR